MLVEIWSDIVCPWCYIGKRQFEEGLRRVLDDMDGDVAIETVFRSYQLDPTAPVDTVTPVVEAYARKFGGLERAHQIIDHLTDAAAGVGIVFHMDRALRANTLLAHRLLWVVLRDHGAAAQAVVKESLMRAYFTDGRNVGDAATIVDAASDALHPDEPEKRESERIRLEEALSHGEGLGEVTEQLATAAAHGITAVPTFVIDGRWAIPGAQDADTFEQVLRRMLVQSA